MKCPFCAEIIQDEAIYCRFCGATLKDGQWQEPVLAPAAAPRPATHPAFVTMKTTAVLFMISAVMGATSLTSEIPLFGKVVGGAVAILYHASYIAFFIAMADALWKPRRWGVSLMFAGCIFYTLDKLRYIMDKQGRMAEVMNTVDKYGLRDMIDPDQIVDGLKLSALALTACWWLFLLYLALRRDYFTTGAKKSRL